MAEKEQQPTAEALKQRRKREKAAAKDAALGVEKFTVEVAGVFNKDLKRLMRQHGFNNQQEVFQNLLRNVIAADFETAAQMLKCVTTPFVVTEKVSRAFYESSRSELAADLGDEIIQPAAEDSMPLH
ncbi:MULTISPECIES: hypothetical protein [unclassified Pseudomonas]|uniref:hypothetical protein n=1 Tax=unclassified Pseudomonas TaxID=196821 RepID=UPI0015A44689|nr:MULTISPECIES: hypothetical protein [unclassified Pseudomonas]NWB63818.1 hypothetical protein [Pseudomonas sp. F1002]NWB73943.1 hypothetical protein [Pseudomonas sp. G5001]